MSCTQPSAFVADSSDCDDNDPNINPIASEICDGIDNNCDGLIDDDDPNVTGQIIWYPDNDGDGFGDPKSSQLSCTQPSGFVADSSDCNDNDSNINPIASEICDGMDNNCDGLVDDEDLNVDCGSSCDDGIQNGGEVGVDCGGSCPDQCGPPDARCGIFNIFIDPENPDYNGPESQDIWLIPVIDIDNGSTWSSGDPKITTRRLFRRINFDWTTGGACVDQTPDGTIDNNDRGINYRNCLPLERADINRGRFYLLRVQDEFGSDRCLGYVRVRSIENSLKAVPSSHYVTNSDAVESTTNFQTPKMELKDGKEAINISIFPNPGRDFLQISFTASESKAMRVRVTDLSGKLMVENNFEALVGLNQVKLDLHSLHAGSYFVSVQGLGKEHRSIWVKLN